MSISIDLAPALEARLRTRAEVAGESVPDYVESLLQEALGPIPLDEAVALYDRRVVSQGQAAALAGVSRREFIDALGRAGVSVFQYDAGEVLAELSRG